MKIWGTKDTNCPNGHVHLMHHVLAFNPVLTLSRYKLGDIFIENAVWVPLQNMLFTLYCQCQLQSLYMS